MKKFLFLLICVNSILLTAQSQNWQTYDSLRTVYQNKRSNDTALFYAQKALAQAEKEFGKKDTNYCNTLTRLVELYYGKGKYEQCIKYGTTEMEIRKEILGEKNSSYATSLNNLALLYMTIGNYSACEPLYFKAINIQKEILGEKAPEYALSLNNLAGLYMTTGNFQKAEPLFIESMKIKKEVLGEKDPNYATSLNNLALLYDKMGNFAEAEPLYIEAMNIRKEVQGVKHPDYAQSLFNLAGLYHEMGNYAAAEPLYHEAKGIRKEIQGVKHPEYALCLNNLGSFYQAKGNSASSQKDKADKFTTAEPLYIEAKSIQKEVLGVKHPDYLTSLNNLGGLYVDMGNYTAAEALYIEVKNTRKEVLGDKHPLYASSLSNLATLYYIMGNYIASEPLQIEAMNIRNEVLGNKHPHYAISMRYLADLYHAIGNNEKSEFYYLQNINICLTNIKQNLGFLSEKEKENYLKTFGGYFNAFSSFAFQRYKENPLISQKLFDITLANKGLLLSSSNHIINEINSSSDTLLVDQYKKWQVLKEDIGRYGQWSKAKLKKVNVKLDSLENIANTMEKEISLKSKAFSNDLKNNAITWNHVQEKLNDKDAAIEFMTYQPLNNKFKASDTTIYYALVLRKEDKYPRMLSLSNNFELAALLGKTELYKTTAQVKGIKPIVNTYVDDETESQVLYKLIWRPLDSLLAGKEKIYVSLTGLLNKIAFEVLQDDKGALLLNKYDLYFVNSTRQLAVEEISKAEVNKTMALFGGINYEMDTTQIKGSGNKNKNIYNSRALSSDTTRGNNWNYLQGTLTEVNNIDKIFIKKKWNTKVYTGSDATEEAFKALTRKNSPTIIHISTHGFFFPEPDSSTYKTTRNPFKTKLNPLWRSGIILAGANNAWQCKPTIEGQEDGVLTAYEVANCNLRNTDLVVLSACETGLGDIKTGEGVYGLQRAFQVAGAKSVIMSLWQVPDKETTELMTLFYESYIKTKNKHDSFRKAQQTMAKKYAPYYWAAFVLVE